MNTKNILKLVCKTRLLTVIKTAQSVYTLQQSKIPTLCESVRLLRVFLKHCTLGVSPKFAGK